MRLPFTLANLAGAVDIRVEATGDPHEWSAPPDATGLAHCTATIDYPGKGYAALLGWVQLVRSTDNRSGGERFEMDPLTFVGEVPHPFGFFGVAPTLFDAPSRPTRADLDWLAHSFLCHIADYEGRRVHALTGFSWGFTITAGAATVVSARALTPTDWDQHLDLLHAEHPEWRFASGFHSALPDT